MAGAETLGIESVSIPSLVFLTAGALLAVEPPVADESSDEPPVTDESSDEPPVTDESSDEPPVADESSDEPPVAESSDEPPVADESSDEPPVADESSDEAAEPRTVEELGEEYGWEEAPPARTIVEPDATEKTRRAVAETPRGWTFGARLERDVATWGMGIDLIGGLQVSWSDQTLGAAAEITMTRPIGVRIEGRGFFWPRGWIRPWLGGGPVLYGFEIGMRAAGGVTWKVVAPIVVELDVAYEFYLKKSVEFNDDAVIVAVGVGYNLY